MKERVAKERFDFIYYPGIREEEAETVFQTQKRYYQIVENVLSAKEIESVFDLRPPRDNRPYFSNFFPPGAATGGLDKSGEKVASFWRKWFLVGSANFSSGSNPGFLFNSFSYLARREGRSSPVRILKIGGVLTGAGFMLMEISLFIKLEMIVGLPFYTFSLLLLILLICSGLGSWRMRRGLSFREVKILTWLHPLALSVYFGFLLLFKGETAFPAHVG